MLLHTVKVQETENHFGTLTNATHLPEISEIWSTNPSETVIVQMDITQN